MDGLTGRLGGPAVSFGRLDGQHSMAGVCWTPKCLPTTLYSTDGLYPTKTGCPRVNPFRNRRSDSDVRFSGYSLFGFFKSQPLMTPSETRFAANHIRPRPKSGVVVTLASGRQAGKSYGMDGSTFEIGFDSSCEVPLANETESGDSEVATNSDTTPRRLRVERGSTGWSIRDLGGLGFFLNQSFVRSSNELRSGDIVRLTWKGPDVQFLLQSSSEPLNGLVAKYLPDSDGGADEMNPPAIPEIDASVPQAPVHDEQRRPTGDQASDPSFSARDTRVVSSSIISKVAQSNAASGSNNNLRKTVSVSREALSAVHTLRASNRARLSVTWIVVAAAVVIIALLFVIAYLSGGSQEPEQSEAAGAAISRLSIEGVMEVRVTGVSRAQVGVVSAKPEVN
jgi:hypothetical protein